MVSVNGLTTVPTGGLGGSSTLDSAELYNPDTGTTSATGKLTESPILDHVAAISVGLKDGTALLDLDYPEDSACDTDMNVVMTGSGGFVEVQGTAEGAPFQPEELNAMLALARQGLEELFDLQRASLAD